MIELSVVVTVVMFPIIQLLSVAFHVWPPNKLTESTEPETYVTCRVGFPDFVVSELSMLVTV